MAEHILADGLWVQGALIRTFRASDLTAAATTQIFSIDIPDGARVYRARSNLGAFFDTGGVTAVTVQAGNTADPDGLFTALNVFDTTVLATFGVETEGVLDVDGATGTTFEATNTSEVLFTSTTANLDQLTNGVIHVAFWWDRMVDPL